MNVSPIVTVTWLSYYLKFLSSNDNYMQIMSIPIAFFLNKYILRNMIFLFGLLLQALFCQDALNCQFFHWPQRWKWLIFLPTLPTKRIKTDEYHPPLQSGRGCDLSSLVLPVFHSGQPMRRPHPVWGRWKMEGGRLLCSLRWHPNHFLIYNFTTTPPHPQAGGKQTKQFGN